MALDIDGFLNPKSIAIVGASENPSSVPGRLVQCLKSRTYSGDVYPINPKHKELYGYKCYPSILDLPNICDLIIIIVQAKLVLSAVEQCVEKGCKNILIVSSGFAEMGSEGREMQNKLNTVIRKNELNVLGPNSQGFFNLIDSVAANFSQTMSIDNPIVGPVGFVSQSGAVGYGIYSMAQDDGIGASYIIATGNEMSISVIDFLEYFLDDQNVKIMVAYAENLKDGRRLPEIGVRALQCKKPIFLYKVGRSERAKKAAMSHTGSMAGNDQVLDALCKQYGIIRPIDTTHINDAVKIYLAEKELPSGKRIGIMSTSGGLAVTMADECSALGLEVPDFSDRTHKELEDVIPDLGTTHNPVDVSAQILVKVESFKKAMRIILADENIDILVVLISAVTGTLAERIAADVVEVFNESNKLVSVVWSTSARLIEGAMNILTTAKVPVYRTPSQLTKALYPFMAFAEKRRNLPQNSTSMSTHRIVNAERQSKAKAYISEKKKILNEYESKMLLSMYDIPVTKEDVASDSKKAANIAKKLGFPVAIKINSSQTPHKSEIGGLKINIKNSEEAVQAYDEIIENVRKAIANSDIKEVLVQEMITGGYEVMLGAVNDPDYGPVVLFGMGGIYVEILHDVSYRVAPIDYPVALEMINEVKGSKILKGARGKVKADIHALANAIVSFSQLLVDLAADYKEIDVNPLVVLPEGKGVKVVDALIIK